MQVKIIRGQNQIGGSIIEISTEYTKVIFDIGINLDEQGDVEVPQIEGLFCGDPSYDAVFVSHYHSDHVLATGVGLGSIVDSRKDIVGYLAE